ncbi:uncharacterized protein EMH_0077790 [Eimeria mitis]|uniref:ER membrane protein complex subunit 7 beta-sandwich domain-containing protein n=1 Tax=Eimeria mitis TaxID=44415 RepID=U6JSB9_9EIME|nr:uncharacterized protein EMH_0077790 [Eimeria mitis]CDJ26962.1 hypothetical protein, conserved [Eimeria mitis]
MGWRRLLLFSSLCHSLSVGAFGTPVVSTDTGSLGAGSQEVWGHIFCDPAQTPGLTIALNGIQLGNATFLPAFPRGGAPRKSSGVDGSPLGSLGPSAEFRIPPLLPGSYLLEVLHPGLTFPKYRIVTTSTGGSEVYMLNEYLVPATLASLPVPFKVGPTGVPRYFPVQGGFSILDLLRQPLVILVMVSLGIMYFLRKMQEAQTEAENQQLEQEPHEQHAVDNMQHEPPESAFVQKLLRQSGC